MAGLQDTPLRIPDVWSATWFRQFVAEVLAKGDVRNAIGAGVTITSNGNSVATISTDSETSGAISAHNADVNAHAAAIGQAILLHTLERDPHPTYGDDTESFAFFMGE